MGKSRNKDRSEVEQLKGMVKQLRKQLKHARKAEHILEDMIIEDVPVIVEEVVNDNVCPKCKHVSLTTFEAPHAIFVKCKECDFSHKKEKK